MAMNNRIRISRKRLLGWLGLPLTARIGLGLPVGAPSDDDIVLVVDVEVEDNVRRPPKESTGEAT